MEIFYEAINELHWYIKRTEFPELREFFESWILIIAPFMPYHAEEWWEKLGKKQFVSLAPFPIPNEKKIDEDAELAEDTVKEAYSDIEHLINLLGKKPNKIFIYTAEHWKQKLYVIVKKEKKFEAVMKSASAEKLFISRMKDVARIVQALIKKSYYLPNVMDAGKELEILEDATGFFKREFKCDVFVLPEGKAVEGHVKSKNALPRKPAIVIE